VQVLALVLVPRAVPSLALAMAPATLVGSCFALAAWRERRTMPGSVPLANPLSFGPALMLAGLVAILSLAARWALSTFGSNGIAVVLALTGMSDVDAAVITLSGLPATLLDDRMAGIVLAIPILANTAVKAVMTIVIAGRADGWKASFPLWSALLASGLAMTAWFWA
jgi:uncharacterized membrane protein (DUF4010 family)